MLWMLLSLCLQFTGDYWLRHTRPDWTKAFVIDVDRGVEEVLEVVIARSGARGQATRWRGLLCPYDTRAWA